MRESHLDAHLNVLIPADAMERLRRIQQLVGGPLAGVAREVLYEGLRVTEQRYLETAGKAP